MQERVMIVGDTLGLYVVLKFFIDNLSTGTFALWNPFLIFGFPVLPYLLGYGVLNPIWLFALFFHQIGVSFYTAVLWIYVGYFFLGLLGFYLLAKALLKDEKIAYFAFLMLLFSFVGMSIFTNPNPSCVFVPMMWFFYFLVRLWQSWEKRFFVGIIFTLMIIVSSYLPAYWLTVFILVSILYCIFYGKRLKTDFFAMVTFTRLHLKLIVSSLLVLGVTLIVSFQGYVTLNSGDSLVLQRKTTVAEAYRGGVNVDYQTISGLCITVQTTIKGLFFNLDKISAYFDARYLSVFVYCVLLLSLFNKTTKKGFLFFFLSAILFFLSAGDQTPLCRIFFQYFPFFNLIHGLGLFHFVVGPILILFVSLQLKEILANRLMLPRYAALIAVNAVHILVWLFLRTQPMLLSTQCAILLSALFFNLIVLAVPLRQGVQVGLLIACIVVQPAEVLWRFHDDLEAMDPAKERIARICACPSTTPSFSFVRPGLIEGFDPYDILGSYAQMKDAAGFPFAGAAYPPRWSYYLFEHFKPAAEEYVKYKFYLYDYVRIFDNDEEILPLIEKVLIDKENCALVTPAEKFPGVPLPGALTKDFQEAKGFASAVSGESRDFEILHFDVNKIKIKTSFEKEKFLVYTDNFYPGWKAVVNGKRVPLYRANLAFKGVALPAGDNTLILQYDPWGGSAFYLFALGSRVAFFCYLIGLFLWNRREKKMDLRNDA